MLEVPKLFPKDYAADLIEFIDTNTKFEKHVDLSQKISTYLSSNVFKQMLFQNKSNQTPASSTLFEIYHPKLLLKYLTTLKFRQE